MARGEEKGSRTRKLTRGQKKKVAKKEARKRAKLPGSFRLSWQSFKTLKAHWKPLGGIALVYTVLSLILTGGFSGLNSTVTEIRDSLEDGDKLQTALDGFGLLIGNAGSQAVPFLQTILIIL